MKMIRTAVLSLVALVVIASSAFGFTQNQRAILLKGAASSGPVSHIAPVMTRGRLMTQSIGGGGGYQIQSRSHHIATDDIVGVQIVIANFGVDGNGNEFAPGGTLTVTASVEYPPGTCTPVSFPNGGVIANGGIIVSNMTAMAIPNGSDPFVRIHGIASANMLYQSGQDNAAGDGMNFGPTDIADQTVDCTPVISGTGAIVLPAAIIGYTKKPTACITGDSIGYGTQDGYTGGASGTSLQGGIERSLTTVGFVNTATPSNSALSFIAGHVGRKALIDLSGCTTLIDQLGSNDILTGGQTAAQTIALKQTIWGYFPGKWIAVPTLEPVAQSSNGWIDLAGQDPVPLCPSQVVPFNNIARAFPSGMNQLLELSNVWSSSVDSCRWTVTPAPPYTSDGLHPITAGYVLVPPSGAIDTTLFR